MSSIYGAILDACVTALRDLNLPGIASDHIRRRMLPVAGDRLNTVPCILVCPGGPEKITPDSYEGYFEIEYTVDVAIVAANNSDFATSLETYLNWRVLAMTALQPNTIKGIPSVWSADVDPEDAIDRTALNQQYAYSAFRVRFTSNEQRI